MSTINIGTVIKKLRQERGMVQEQVADYLHVSTQAVSRWETGSALPDITQLPALAYLFNCSADMLLGVDITLKKEHITKIKKEALDFLCAGQYEEAEKILRSALQEYPNSYELMETLTLALANIAYEDKERQKTLREEEIVLGEKILSECTDDMIRNNVILRLCQTYCKVGENEKAMDLANKMPLKIASKESLLGYILKGTEKFKHKQTQIANDIASVLHAIMYLNDDPIYGDSDIKAYNPDELMSLHHKIIDIINIVCEDGNFGSFNRNLSDTHLRLYYSNINKKDDGAALRHLKLATKHAILFDAIPQRPSVCTEAYTSLLLKGVDFGITRCISPESKSQFLLNMIESENLYSRFPSEEIDAIKEDLQKSANPAV